MDDKEQVQRLLRIEQVNTLDGVEYQHDSEAEQRRAERADMIVGWVSVLVGIGFVASLL